MWISKKELGKINDKISELSADTWRMESIRQDLAETRRKFENLEERYYQLLNYFNISQEYQPGHIVTKRND